MYQYFKKYQSQTNFLTAVICIVLHMLYCDLSAQHMKHMKSHACYNPPVKAGGETTHRITEQAEGWGITV